MRHAHRRPAVLVDAGKVRRARWLRPWPTVPLVEALHGDVGGAGRHDSLTRRERHCRSTARCLRGRNPEIVWAGVLGGGRGGGGVADEAQASKQSRLHPGTPISAPSDLVVGQSVSSVACARSPAASTELRACGLRATNRASTGSPRVSRGSNRAWPDDQRGRPVNHLCVLRLCVRGSKALAVSALEQHVAVGPANFEGSATVAAASHYARCKLPAEGNRTFGWNGCAAMFSSLRRSDIRAVCDRCTIGEKRAGLAGDLPRVGSCDAH